MVSASMVSVAVMHVLHTPCHILPPSKIPWGLFLAVLQAQKRNIYFTELAERAEYGKYGIPMRACESAHAQAWCARFDNTLFIQ